MDFGEGLIDWGDKEAVTSFTNGLVQVGKMSVGDQQTVIKASIILVNLGIRLSYEATQKGTSND
jgi:hypothetical protein